MKSIQALYRRRLNRVMAKRQISDLSRSAIVFAPHPDDETLGCGGTIIRKKAAGAAIKIVFMTDGSRSHAGLMAEPELKKIRHQEALQAAQALGVAPEDVIFLGFGDGRLEQTVTAATARIRDWLLAEREAQTEASWPEEVFVPYSLEPPPDHFVTYHAVIAALAEVELAPRIYAYPVWYWRHWPWTSLAGESKRGTLNILKATLLSKLGTAIFEDFQHSVCVRSARSQKHAALAKHASQMQRPASDPSWPILKDVANGDFLDCFFQDYEIFHSPSLRI